MSYELHYWPGIPGRGDFVRLALDAAGGHHREQPPVDAEGRQLDGIPGRSGRSAEGRVCRDETLGRGRHRSFVDALAAWAPEEVCARA